MIEFQGFPKIARLNRDIIITEKIDGTNAAVVINEEPLLGRWQDGQRLGEGLVVNVDGRSLLVGAQSRNRLITPEQDSHGFAAWVFDNATALAEVLGPGRHFGEWWGSGIQRGYGLPKGAKRFSLFNVKRWGEVFDGYEQSERVQDLINLGMDTVPVLYEGPYSQWRIEYAQGFLRTQGSVAAPGFNRPEGIVVYHTAANQMFKVTLEGDEVPKSLAAA